MNEHGRKPDQPMHRNLKNCSYFQELGQRYSLPCDGKTIDIDIKEHLINPLQPGVAFLYPLKTSENLKVF